MIGRTYYRFRQRFKHGLYTAWQRDVARRRILRSKPVTGLNDPTCEIHVLTCSRDWLDLMWALKTLFAVSQCRFRLCVHEDGTVPDFAISCIHQHFPEARVIPRRVADDAARKQLRLFPRSFNFRQSNSLALKVFDFLSHLECDRMLLLDSDILFFREPSALLERIHNVDFYRNTLNKDWGMGYTIDPANIDRNIDFKVDSPINSGLGLIHRESYRLDWFEEWLGIPGLLGHPHRVEQTLVALASSRFGHSFLPEDYDVSLTSTPPNAVVKHYTGPIRHLMYREGLVRAKQILESTGAF